MGAFFSNVQVRMKDRPLADLLAALRRSVGEMDDAQEGEKADRTVFVFAPDAHGWVAIYDQFEEPEPLAALASEALSTHAVAISVHDSDVLLLSLYASGERIDRYDSNPGYYRERVSEKKRAELEGDPKVWAPLLIEGDAQRFAEVLASTTPIVERKLRKIAALVGWEHSNTGYRYASADGEVLPEGTLTLRFRHRVRPPHQTPKTDPPSFLVETHTGHRAELHFAVGTSLTLKVDFRNEGRAGRGLSVLAWGSALEEELGSVASFDVVVDGKRALLVPHARASSLGGRVLVAEADVAFDAGMSGPPPPTDIEALLDAVKRGRIQVTLEGRVLREGRGELFLGLLPDENDAGSDAHGFRLAIAPSITTMLEAASQKRATKKLGKKR